ncbi:hypothetical protein [Naasia aerilata]|uniref:Resolvase/invertase-type recombinase catalytic domain-containing protein n=1 Tax=Naasia aerilata TaxID=1162966 RepID=A0ABN6XJK4_9MICO|nr:hypothetical protein [Naasia aerilata]BDZ44283.1 hypothetical protein GCM10025866_01920 [Naasia aerilata]
MNVVGYVRLFRASREESTPIVRQREVIARTAESRGWQLVGIEEDNDTSATRPGWTAPD